MRRFNLVVFVAIGIIMSTMTAFISVAEASSTYTTLTSPGVINGENQALGKIKIDINDVNALTSPLDVVTVSLPSGITVNNYVPGGDVNSLSGSATIAAPDTVSGEINPLSGSGAFTTKMTGTNSFDIWINHASLVTGTGVGEACVLTVDFYSLDVAGQSGDITATFYAPSGSGLTTGAATIAVVGFYGTDLYRSSINTVSPGQGVILDRVTFSQRDAGSLTVNSENPTTQNTVILTLPQGVTWSGIMAPSYPAEGSEGHMVIEHLDGRDAYVTVNASTIYEASIQFNPVVNIDQHFIGEITITVSGSNPGVTPETKEIARIPGIKIYTNDAKWVVSRNSDGIQRITISGGTSGLQYFSVEASLTNAHTGTETLVFSHFRSGVQQSVVARINNFDSSVLTTQVGLNVEAGDVIMVYIVDSISNSTSSNPVVLQT